MPTILPFTENWCTVNGNGTINVNTGAVAAFGNRFWKLNPLYPGYVDINSVPNPLISSTNGEVHPMVNSAGGKVFPTNPDSSGVWNLSVLHYYKPDATDLYDGCAHRSASPTSLTGTSLFIRESYNMTDSRWGISVISISGTYSATPTPSWTPASYSNTRSVDNIADNELCNNAIEFQNIFCNTNGKHIFTATWSGGSPILSGASTGDAVDFLLL